MLSQIICKMLANFSDMISEYLFPSTPESAKKRGRVTGTGNSDVAKKGTD